MTADENNYNTMSEACNKISEAVETITNLIYESGEKDEMYHVDINVVESRVLKVLMAVIEGRVKLQEHRIIGDVSLFSMLDLRYTVERLGVNLWGDLEKNLKRYPDQRQEILEKFQKCTPTPTEERYKIIIAESKN